MARKETAGPHFTTSSGSCSVDQGTSSAATELNHGRCPVSSHPSTAFLRVPGETREAAWQQPDNQAANRIQECQVCRFVFTNTEAFQNHTADHSLGKNKNCAECGKLFMTSRVLTRHLLLHGEPSFQCGLCGQKFHRKDRLKNHMLAWHFGSQD
ncbi:zinc finger protein 418-like [Dermacentor albipictus]|uniref:zinc finger protein 418-like n=1 Tax=Dermacentor albipictus TaxID=60249 RepID=UPI0038FC7BCF